MRAPLPDNQKIQIQVLFPRPRRNSQTGIFVLPREDGYADESAGSGDGDGVDAEG